MSDWVHRFHSDQRRLDGLGWMASAASVALLLAAGTVVAMRLQAAEGLRDATEDAMLLELEPLPPAPALEAMSAPAPEVPMTEAPEAPELVEEAALPDAAPAPDAPVPQAAPLAEAPPPVPDTVSPPDAPPPPPPEPEPQPEPVAEPEQVAEPMPDIRPKPRPDPKPERKADTRPKPEKPAAAPPSQRASAASSAAATPKATGTAPAAVSRGQLRDLQRQWGGAIQSRVLRRMAYPRAANGAEGTPTVRLSIALNGQLRGVSLVRSSGNDVLDAAAVRIANAAAPFPAAPRGLTGDNFTFTIPMQFNSR